MYISRDVVFDERLDNDNSCTTARPNRGTTKNPDHQKSHKGQNQTETTLEQEQQQDLSAKNGDYKPLDLQTTGNDEVQNAL